MFKKLSGFTLALIGLTLFFSACKKEYETVATLDERNIEAYIAKNNITAIKDPSGFYYQIIEQGEGEVLNNTDSLFYDFDFKRSDNSLIVESPVYQIASGLVGYADRFTLGGSAILLTPVRLTLSKLSRGGIAKLIIPSSMVFGKNGNSTLNVGSNEIIVVDLSVYKERFQYQIDDIAIKRFIADQKLTMIKDSSRVYYSVEKEGTGAAVTSSSTITINYSGKLLTGTEFEVSSDSTSTGSVDSYIKGWGDVLPGNVKKGGKIRMLIPSDRAYGANTDPDGIIPPNAVLDFTVEIKEVK